MGRRGQVQRGGRISRAPGELSNLMLVSVLEQRRSWKLQFAGTSLLACSQAVNFEVPAVILLGDGRGRRSPPWERFPLLSRRV